MIERPRQGARSRAAGKMDARAARPGDGGAGDRRTSAAARSCRSSGARSARSTRPEAARRDRDCSRRGRARGRAPARPRQGQARTTTTTRSADGRLVAAARQRRVRARAGRRRHDAAQRHDDRGFGERSPAGDEPGRARLLRRLVRLRSQGPARPLRPQARPRPLVARLLRQGQARALPQGAAGLAARGARRHQGAALRPRRLRERPDPACWDQNRFTVASAIGVDPFLFQNRPTFQQTVEVTSTRRAE